MADKDDRRTSDTGQLLAILLELEDHAVNDNAFLRFRTPWRCLGRRVQHLNGRRDFRLTGSRRLGGKFVAAVLA